MIATKAWVEPGWGRDERGVWDDLPIHCMMYCKIYCHRRSLFNWYDLYCHMYYVCTSMYLLLRVYCQVYCHMYRLAVAAAAA